jgi:membrane protease subunit HflK
MSDRHDHPHDHNHDHGPEPQAPVPLMPDDAGSRALSDALRSSFLIVKIVMVLLVILFFASGFFTVGPQERAVKLRFGKPVGEGEAALLGPGAHWAWPAPIDEIVRIPFSQVQEAKSSVGWYATTPEQEATRTETPPGPTLNPAVDSYLLTGDANIIHVRATLRYQVIDPQRYIFAFTNAAQVVTNLLDEAIYFTAAQFNVDDALTRNQVAFRERIERRVDQLASQQRLGIAVEQVTLTSVIPPRQVAEKFRAALEASVRTERGISEARSYANDTVSKAQGEAAGRLGVAQSERNRLVEAVAAESKRFTDVLPQYKANPALFKQLWQAEVVQRVLTNAEERLYIPSRSDGGKRTLWVPLSRAPLKPKEPEAPKKDDH